MGQLKDFIEYLEGRIEVTGEAEALLCQLQEKYETYFAEVAKVRKSEVKQLTEHILADRTQLPGWFNEALDRAQAEVKQTFDEKLAALEAALAAAREQAEADRLRSVTAEREVRSKNVSLDQQEEHLKERSEKLLADMERHNAQIRELGRGFGFFANFFKMRRLAATRKALTAEQADVMAHVEKLRNRWVTEEQAHAEVEATLRDGWVAQGAEAAGMQTKIDYLGQARASIEVRSTVEQALGELEHPELQEAGQGDPPCPRCGSPNPAVHHFCYICAQRLTGDRPDFEGSIKEITEINHHHRRFSEAMKACQEIIGLVRGLGSGLEAFNKSVVDMRRTQDKHNLVTLKLDVPRESYHYGLQFDALLETVGRDLSLRPEAFAREVKRLVDQVFTEEQIKVYFETMGQELTVRADAQW